MKGWIKMIYTLDTKVRFAITLGRWTEEEIYTLRELGLDQESLYSNTHSQIEDMLQQMYDDWEMNYLDRGWSVVQD